MAHTLFISDLHLSDETPAIEAGFFALLEQAREADALYILGDFFEVWVGDDDDSDQIQRVANALRALTDTGVPLFLMTGNRDFIMGEAFAARVGATLLGDSEVIDLYGTPTLIMHGDTLCTDDVEYQQLRAVMRDPAWQADMLSKSLEERRAFAMALRQASKDKHANNPENIIDVNIDAVNAAMREADVSRLVHGHTHRPKRHAEDAGERIVLGDWHDTLGWQLMASSEGLALESFDY